MCVWWGWRKSHIKVKWKEEGMGMTWHGQSNGYMICAINNDDNNKRVENGWYRQIVKVHQTRMTYIHIYIHTCTTVVIVLYRILIMEPVWNCLLFFSRIKVLELNLVFLFVKHVLFFEKKRGLSEARHFVSFVIVIAILYNEQIG